MALSDNPILAPGEDTLGRAALASDFVRQVLAVDVSQGAVVGVLGPWGQGKTSFVNLAKAGFDAAGIEVLAFNPWMFSGADALIESFFVELSAQLKIRAGLTQIAADFASYGDAFSGLGWLPVAGP
jgi:predicted KAP-like P-loop ATPase